MLPVASRLNNRIDASLWKLGRCHEASMGVHDDGKMIVIGYQLFSRQCLNGENTCVGRDEKVGARGMKRARSMQDEAKTSNVMQIYKYDVWRCNDKAAVGMHASHK